MKDKRMLLCARAGMVRRVRGVAYGMRVAPAMTNRLVDGARGVLNALLADVYIFTDHMAGSEAGASPGFGLALVAETTSGLLLGAQAASMPAVRVHTCPHQFSHAPAACPATLSPFPSCRLPLRILRPHASSLTCCLLGLLVPLLSCNTGPPTVCILQECTVCSPDTCCHVFSQYWQHMCPLVP